MKLIPLYLTLALTLSLTQAAIAFTEIKNESNQKIQVNYGIQCSNLPPTHASKTIPPKTTDYIIAGDQCMVKWIGGITSLGDKDISVWGNLEDVWTPKTVTDIGQVPEKYAQAGPRGTKIVGLTTN